MKDKIFKHNGYDLHIIQTDKFRKNLVQINFFNKLVKKDVTKRSFINDLLVDSTMNFPSRRLVVSECENLYNVEVNVFFRRIGNYVITSFKLYVLDEKYTEEGMFAKSLDFLLEVIFNPNIKDNSFNSDSFDLVKRRIENNIKSLKENTSLYGFYHALECMDKKAPVSVKEFGYLEDLKKINSTNLYEYYKSMIKNDQVSVYVVGNVDIEETNKFISSKINIKESKNKVKYQKFTWKKLNKEYKNYQEKLPVLQANLFVISKLKKITYFEEQYVLPVYINILGGSSTSKLFSTIREKESLAYSINANGLPLDNTIVVSSGIDSNNYEKTLELIKKNMKDMAEGKISSIELNRAIKAYLFSLKGIADKVEYIADIYFAIDYRKIDDLEIRKEKIKEVTIEDVVSLAKKICLDTVYLLHGGENNANK